MQIGIKMISFLLEKRKWPIFIININPFQPRMLNANFDWNWARRFGKDFSNVNIFLLLCYYLLFTKDAALHLNKWIFVEYSFVSSLIEIDPVVLVKICFITSIKFYHYAIISPWKRAKALCLNKHESSSLKNALCQVWLKLA